MVKQLIDKLRKDNSLNKEEWIYLFENSDPETDHYLFEQAREVTDSIYGKQIYLRGLIEIGNICVNDCFYCGIRKSNRNVKRYRLAKDTILDCCKEGYKAESRTFVLQSGEDSFSPSEITSFITAVKENYPDCAVTLSLGEQDTDVYRGWFDAGADRYLLRHETADVSHYRKLHPDGMSSEHRKACLYDLKSIGYQVGAGFMTGSPGQSAKTLAEDMLFIKDLGPHMTGIGPFIPHHDTPFADEPAGDTRLTLRCLALIRLMIPEILLPATTALITADERGMEKGFQAGANVLMPDLTPVGNTKQYMLYDNKSVRCKSIAEHIEDIKERIRKAGYDPVVSRGDHPDRESNYV